MLYADFLAKMTYIICVKNEILHLSRRIGAGELPNNQRLRQKLTKVKPPIKRIGGAAVTDL